MCMSNRPKNVNVYLTALFSKWCHIVLVNYTAALKATIPSVVEMNLLKIIMLFINREILPGQEDARICFTFF